MKYLWCPICHSELALTIEEADGEVINCGKFVCARCGSEYPIIRGIPRFINHISTEQQLHDVYADSFGYEWNNFDWLRKEDEYEFFAITDLAKEDLKGKVVLDAGCGGGRFARFVNNYCNEFVGFDYSIAVETAYKLCRDNADAHFVQCDVNKHPFKPNTFDFVYSHGVLHHTPDTKASFDNLPSLVKQDGCLYIAVFRKSFVLLRRADGFSRYILNKLDYQILSKVCGILSNLNKLPYASFFKRFFWFSLQKSREVRICSLFDWYTPKYHYEFTVQEVKRWFYDAGFKSVGYINAWPYCPPKEKYSIPRFWQSFRLGQLLGVIGIKK